MRLSSDERIAFFAIPIADSRQASRMQEPMRPNILLDRENAVEYYPIFAFQHGAVNPDTSCRPDRAPRPT